MSTYRKWLLCGLVFSLLLFLILVGKSFAQSSTNYNITKFVLAAGGLPSQSTNHQVVDVIGQPFQVGVSNSTNHALFSGFLGAVQTTSEPNVLLVPETYATITEALVAANYGDTISVAAGTYPEAFAMKSGVALISRSGPMTTIIERNGVMNLITGATDAIINGFTIAGNDNGEQQAGNGIISNGDNLIVCHCILRNNRIGLYLTDQSQAMIFNNTIDRNESGIYMQVQPSPEIYNNIITNNQNGIYRNTAHSMGDPFIQYNAYFGNTTNFAFYGNAWTTDPGTGELFDDPQYLGGTPFDYHLTGISPCIDMGDPASPHDPDGTRADMGAIFYDQATAVESTPDAKQAPSFYLSSAYPNPFNPETTIDFSVPEPSRVTLTVFNLLGHEVVQLLDENLAQGQYKMKFNAKGLPSGVYFYRLQMRGVSAVRKMVLLE